MMGGVSSLNVNGIEVYKRIPPYQEFLNETSISINDFLNKVCIAETFNDNKAFDFLAVTITGITNTYDSSSNVDWKIIGYNHDNTSNTFDLMAKSSIKDNMKFRDNQQSGSLSTDYLYNQNYEYSEIRTWLQSYANNFSTSLKNKLVTMNIVYNFNTNQPNNQLYYYTNTGDATTDTTGSNKHSVYDKIKLLSCTEFGYSGSGISNMPYNEGNKYYIFSSFSSNATSSRRIIKNTSGNTTYWWLRSRTAVNNKGSDAWTINTDGSFYPTMPANGRCAVVPVIRVSV